jgi:hypothetical protein
MGTPSSKRPKYSPDNPFSKYGAYSNPVTNSNESTPVVSPNPNNSSNSVTNSNTSTPYLLTNFDVKNKSNFKNWLNTIDSNTLVGMNAKSINNNSLQNEILENKLRIIGNTHGNKENDLTSDLNFEMVDHTNKRKRVGGRKRFTTRKRKQNIKKKSKKQKKTRF